MRFTRLHSILQRGKKASWSTDAIVGLFFLFSLLVVKGRFDRSVKYFFCLSFTERTAVNEMSLHSRYSQNRTEARRVLFSRWSFLSFFRGRFSLMCYFVFFFYWPKSFIESRTIISKMFRSIHFHPISFDETSRFVLRRVILISNSNSTFRCGSKIFEKKLFFCFSSENRTFRDFSSNKTKQMKTKQRNENYSDLIFTRNKWRTEKRIQVRCESKRTCIVKRIFLSFFSFYFFLIWIFVRANHQIVLPLSILRLHLSVADSRYCRFSSTFSVHIEETDSRFSAVHRRAFSASIELTIYRVCSVKGRWKTKQGSTLCCEKRKTALFLSRIVETTLCLTKINLFLRTLFSFHFFSRRRAFSSDASKKMWLRNSS